MFLNTVAILLLSSCLADFAQLVSFTLRWSASACISISFLISGCFVDNPDNSLTESTLLSEGLFHRRASDFGSHRFLQAYRFVSSSDPWLKPEICTENTSGNNQGLSPTHSAFRCLKLFKTSSLPVLCGRNIGIKSGFSRYHRCCAVNPYHEQTLSRIS